MNLTPTFTRIFFTILSIFFMTAYMVSGPQGFTGINVTVGIGLGAGLGLILLGFDYFFKRFNLKSFNVTMIGLFFGYLMGQALVSIFTAILDIGSASVYMQPQVLEMTKIGLFLFATYLGTLMTIRASDALSVSIPFVKFSAVTQKKKDILIDPSVLSDARIIDLAGSGIVDHHLILPRFLLKEFYIRAEAMDEAIKNKGRRSLDIVKKLEALPELNLRYTDTDFPEIQDANTKVLRLARLLDANVLTADMSRLQTATIEGIRFINIHSLSTALKPLMQAGETVKIKIQRYGKEPRQGVGYLEDGTMVVINGGGQFLGEIIDAKVLSVKHTTSGRMIFCNAQDEDGEYYDEEEGQ